MKGFCPPSAQLKNKVLYNFICFTNITAVMTDRCGLLTDHLTHSDGLSQGSRGAGASRVHRLHADVQQVPSGQILDDVAVGDYQLGIGHHPVGSCQETRRGENSVGPARHDMCAMPVCLTLAVMPISLTT